MNALNHAKEARLMTMKMFNHNFGKGGSLLAEALGIKMLKHNGSAYRPKLRDVIINWGCSTLPNLSPATILNRPDKVARAINKLSFFQLFPEDGNHGVRVPPWSSTRAGALHWLRNGRKVVCRTKLRSSEGDGIVIATNEAELVDAPLYTKYIPKQFEYRVHVFKGRAIDVTRKVLKADAPRDNVNWYVRNTANGFVFQRNNLDVPVGVPEMAVRAVAACELDFGAVDLIVDKRGNVYVLEVNTAPGIEGRTVEIYANAIRGT